MNNQTVLNIVQALEELLERYSSCSAMPTPDRCPLCYADKLNRQLYPQLTPCEMCPWQVLQGQKCYTYYLRAALPPDQWAKHRHEVISTIWLPTYRRAVVPQEPLSPLDPYQTDPNSTTTAEALP